MLRAARIISALAATVLAPVALAQKSSGYMDLDDLSSDYGVQLAVFRIVISKTDAICPQQTGLFRIAPNGRVTDIEAILWWPLESSSSKGMDLSPVPAPDDFTHRRRLAMEACRIDLDITEQQKRDGEWIPLLSLLRPNAPERPSTTPSHAIDEPPAKSSARLEAFDRHLRARAHAGNLLQGWIATSKGSVGFEGAKDCFDAVATYRIDQLGLTLLFPAGLEGELNRFFIERVDADADHSTLFLSRGSCRVGFTISASIFRDGVWIPLPIAPPRPRPSPDTGPAFGGYADPTPAESLANRAQMEELMRRGK
jgi:hypothetical protein